MEAKAGMVSHGKSGSSMVMKIVRCSWRPSLSVKLESGGGLLLLRHVMPQARRHVDYFAPARTGKSGSQNISWVVCLLFAFSVHN